MARTTITAQTLAGAYPALPIAGGSADLTMTPADTVNQNMTPLIDSKTLLLAHNTGASGRTITITSVADTLNRTGDITAYAIVAGAISRFGPFKTVGWANGGKLNFEANNAEVVFAVITLS